MQFPAFLLLVVSDGQHILLAVQCWYQYRPGCRTACALSWLVEGFWRCSASTSSDHVTWDVVRVHEVLWRYMATYRCRPCSMFRPAVRVSDAAGGEPTGGDHVALSCWYTLFNQRFMIWQKLNFVITNGYIFLYSPLWVLSRGLEKACPCACETVNIKSLNP